MNIRNLKLKSKSFIYHHETLKISRFTVIGALSSVIDYFLFIALLALRFNPIIATIISYFISAIFNFNSNKIWTFKNKDKEIWYQITTYILINTGCLAINIFFVSIGLALKKETKNPYLIIIFKILGDVVASFFSYIGNRFIIFSDKGKQLVFELIKSLIKLK